MKTILVSKIIFLSLLASHLSSQQIDQSELLKEKQIRTITFQKLVYNSYYSDYDTIDYTRIDSINEFGKTYKSIIQHENGYHILTETTYTDNNEIYDILKYRDYSNSPFKAEEFYYNKNGQLIKKEFFGKNDQHQKTEYFRYNDQGQINLRKVVQVSTDRETEYKYYYKNQLVDIIECIQDGNHVFNYEHKYDPQSNLIEKYKMGRFKHTIVELEYSDNNKIISKTYSKIHSILNSNEFVHLALSDIRMGDDKIFYQYNYDEKTGLLKEIFETKNNEPIAKFELTYYP